MPITVDEMERMKTWGALLGRYEALPDTIREGGWEIASGLTKLLKSKMFLERLSLVVRREGWGG